MFEICSEKNDNLDVISCKTLFFKNTKSIKICRDAIRNGISEINLGYMYGDGSEFCFKCFYMFENKKEMLKWKIIL